MNCNLCPYRKLCTAPKSQGYDYIEGQPFGFTTPTNLDDCPLLRVLKKEEDKQE